MASSINPGALMAARSAVMSPSVIQNPMHAVIAPLGPPVTMNGMVEAPPRMMSPAPNVQGPDNPLMDQERLLQSQMGTKPEGFWQKFGHAAGMAGRIAGDVIAPGQTELIVKGLGNEGIGPRANEIRQNKIGAIQSELSREGLEQAQQQEAGERTREMPTQLQRQLDSMRSQLAENGLQMDDAGNISPVSPDKFSPKLKADLLPKTADEAFIRANPNATPEQIQDFEQKPLSPEQADALNGTWNPIAEKYHLPQSQFRPGMPHADASTLAASLNNVVARGQAGIKVNVDTGDKDSARADKAFQYNNGELDKLSTPISGLMQRFGNLETSFTQNTPQANALVAPELLTVMAGGQGSGLRMNEAEIGRIVGGRSAWENLKASIQHWSTDPKSAQSITPEQNREIGLLIGAVSSKLKQKSQILNDAYSKLLDTIDPSAQRRIVADARKAITDVDAGTDNNQATPPPGAKIIKWEDVK